MDKCPYSIGVYRFVFRCVLSPKRTWNYVSGFNSNKPDSIRNIRYCLYLDCEIFTCILFALCTLAVPLIGNYIFLFNNEEVSIFTLKEYAMKTNNTVIAQIVSDIEIQKSRKVKSALGKVGAIILCLVDLFAGAFMPKSVPNFLAPSEIVVICIFALLVLLVYSCKIKIQGVYLSNDLRSKISNFKVNTPNNK